MIADNILYIAIFVFVTMVIGLVLTVMEFRYGSPRQQQREADRNVQAGIEGASGRPAR